jgi:hypothetical protein
MSSGRTGVRGFARNQTRRRVKLRLEGESLRGLDTMEGVLGRSVVRPSPGGRQAVLAEWVKPIRFAARHRGEAS